METFDHRLDGTDKKKAQDYLDELILKVGKAKNDSFSFLLIGRTGVGKSSTVNSLMGKEVALTNDEKPQTMEVTVYEGESFGVKFNVIDTPGLCDDFEEKGNDDLYINEIIQKVKTFDSMWFVAFLHETRVSSDEKKAIRIISEAFSQKAWEHAVIIFTFSSYVPKEEFKSKLEKRTRVIREEIAKHTGEKIAQAIPSVAIDNKYNENPDGNEWLGELYTTVFERISGKGALPFLMATAEMVNKGKNKDKTEKADKETQRIKLTPEQQTRVNKKIDAAIIPALATTGAAVGALLGPVGAVIGGIAGATIGLIAWLRS